MRKMLNVGRKLKTREKEDCGAAEYREERREGDAKWRMIAAENDAGRKEDKRSHYKDEKRIGKQNMNREKQKG